MELMSLQAITTQHLAQPAHQHGDWYLPLHPGPGLPRLPVASLRQPPVVSRAARGHTGRRGTTRHHRHQDP